MKLLPITILIALSTSLFGQIQKRSSSNSIMDKTIMFKVKSQYEAYCTKNGFTHQDFIKIADHIGMASCNKEFPNHKAPEKNIHGTQGGLELANLSTIYKLKYNGNYKVRDIIPYIQKTGLFEYVEPFFIHRMLLTTNDDEIGSQWHLDTIKAQLAWDTEDGDTNVVIGITDAGIEFTHPDLVDNIKYNYADPINGSDDDGDGYTDNYRGWDMVGNDNDPTTHWSSHGLPVTGLASATTNNDTMVAGTGYKCKFIPINVANSSGAIVAGYQGVVYAADHGCHIINASWGEKNTWSRYGQDVITYATINKNALVVCAAGNDNTEDKYYPACLDWALSVGGTDQSNEKWVANVTKGSNYNYHVDICAPSTGIFSTYSGDKTLGNRTGTSMASPMVAGAAGLIKAKNPSYTAIQIGEVLKATADSLEGIGGNATYSNKIGEGLLNMQRAITESHISGFVMTPTTFSDGNDGVFIAGDTVSLSGYIYNFLGTSTAGATATLTSPSANVEIIDGVVNIGVLNNGFGKNISSTPFKFKVGGGVTTSEETTLLITFTDGANNSTKQAVDIVLNPDYYTITDNKLDITVGASGKLGYNVINAKKQGVGVEFNGAYSWLWQMSFCVLDDATKCSYVGDGDFETTSELSVDKSGDEADVVVNTAFDDDPAAANKLDISVKQKSMAWTEAQYDDFVILEYKIINNSLTNYSNIHAGIYADWDINTATLNTAGFDATKNLAYAMYGSNYIGAIHALSDSAVHHYAFDNNGANSSIYLYDGFSDAEKVTALTSGNVRAAAGTGDVSHMIGSGPFTLNAGDSIVVPFAVIAGNYLTDVQAAALESDTAYNDIRSLDFSMISTNATCKDTCNGTATVTVSKGVAPYTYSWNAPGNPTTASVTGLCAGTHTVVVTDKVGNVDSTTVTITEPTAISISFSDTTHDVGGGCIGELTSLVSGGTPTYVIDWSDNAGRDSLHAVGLCQGDYILTITDANSCVAKDTVSIDNTVGVEERIFGEITLFPNPSNTIVTFSNLNNEIQTIEIYDVGGRLVETLSNNGSLVRELNVSNLSEGIYKAKFISNELNHVKRFTVIK